MKPLLEVWTNEDGDPWAAFVFGKADFTEVAAMITRDAVEEVTDRDIFTDELPADWKPDVREHHIRLMNPDDEESLWEFCKAGDTGATLITGHRFAGVET